MQDYAEVLNAKLKAGGVVQVTTCAKSTLYNSKHAGWFFSKGGNLYVKHGKGSVCLSFGSQLLVGIRTGGYV